MRKGHSYWLFLPGLALVGALICLHRDDVSANVQYYYSIATSVAFMLCLVVGAFFVGAIPRKARTKQAQIVCSIIGWPMFATFLALMAVCVWAMVDLDYPGYMLLIGFLWVLAHLTWKIFIHPTAKGLPPNYAATPGCEHGKRGY
jgi:hypothetical protein